MRPSNVLLTTIVSVAAVAGPSFAESFRIETEIYVGGDKDPVVENLTLFSGGVVYDFLMSEPEEITVFDMKRGRFVLLSPSRKLQTMVTTDEVDAYLSAMKANAPSEELDSLMHARATVDLDDDGWLILKAEQLTYRVKGQEPKFPAAANLYQQFADYYARFNATEPGNLPPFVRVKLNQTIAERGWIPTEVVRELTSRKGRTGGRKHEVRSRHSAIWLLSSRDRERIDNVARYRAEFTSVSLKDYRQAALVAQQNATAKR